MKDQLQSAYDKLVKMSNLNFVLSKEDYMNKMKRELLAKSEAFEAAADCLFDKFREIIKPCDTLRFLDAKEKAEV